MTFSGEIVGKLGQPYPPGSPEWERLWGAGRAAPEGSFGTVKSPHTEGIRRGVHEFRGNAWDHLFLGLAFTLSNVRSLKNWNDTFQPDLDHILIAEDTNAWHGFDLHTEETAISRAVTYENQLTFVYEYVNHTCDKVEPEERSLKYKPEDADPEGHTKTLSRTETMTDQCQEPDCQVIRTYGTSHALVHEQHHQALCEQLNR